MSQEKRRKIKLEMPTEPNATYANTVMISHTQHEVFYDFIQIIPQEQRARVQKRIVMTPAHAKMFLRAMEENLRRYEERHGEITLPPRPDSLAEQLFRGASGGDNGGDHDEDE